MNFRESAAKISDDLVALRRSLHREPELGLHLPKTQAAVLSALAGLPLEITTGRSLSSVVAVLRGGRPGPSVLLRGDMDALPVTEQTGLDFSSTIPGVMHACGHDLHTAILVGAARLLSAVRDNLAGDVIFMFQPGEEGPGGAQPMLAEGVLSAAGDPPVAAYCLHVSAVFPHGMFFGRRGVFGAAHDTCKVRVRGKGGHGSTPFRARDPIPAACEMVLALQTMVTRGFDVFDPVVLTVGRFHAGTVDNVIPATAEFAASLRSFSNPAREKLIRRTTEVVEGIAAAQGLEVDVELERGYPAVVNDAGEADFAAATAAEVFGDQRYQWLENPKTGSEDMSFVLEKVPGAYLNLGACPPDLDPMTAATNHSPDALFDDAVIADGSAFFAEMASRRLARG
ncbi:hippurate hydrolase [Asanoa ferruginea]|uniref:Hippurate hydrolase n=1 Tax=Asanoa ferruginea TaxID=53367 RepID=A0A3D9ZTW6_9ACTN|nr:M20 family metallopeptidase [Asanoa ferruginea]REF97120.1 hippurate hydrolase [Asanoa ferruginea]GIF53790.1 amidohydrolase [Asanoa ferruginea]